MRFAFRRRLHAHRRNQSAVIRRDAGEDRNSLSPVCPQVNNQTFALYLRQEGYTVPLRCGASVRLPWGLAYFVGWTAATHCRPLAGWHVREVSQQQPRHTPSRHRRLHDKWRRCVCVASEEQLQGADLNRQTSSPQPLTGHARGR